MASTGSPGASRPTYPLISNVEIARARLAKIERLEGALRQIELNTRTGDPKTLKLNWIAREALTGREER